MKKGKNDSKDFQLLLQDSNEQESWKLDGVLVDRLSFNRVSSSLSFLGRHYYEESCVWVERILLVIKEMAKATACDCRSLDVES
jgi:hypothetical protein